MTIPHGFKRVVLNLARSPDFPEGSNLHGYELQVPLTEEGRIDREAWQQQPDSCRVRRFWDGEDDLRGVITYRDGEGTGGNWYFDYDTTSEFEDDQGFRLGDHVFLPDEYVSIAHDEEMHTFRVVSVDQAV